MISIPGVPPIMMWAGFLVLVGILLALDLGVFHRKAKEVSIKEAMAWTGVWFGLAMIFNLWVAHEFGREAGLQFLTGYLIEESLSVDNLFVFIVIFTAFNIPGKLQHRVLFWGIMGAIVTRGLFITLGIAIIHHFIWTFLIFGLVLLYAAYRMQFGEEKKFNPDESRIVRLVRKVMPVSSKVDDETFFTKENGKTAMTVLLLALIVIELTDIVFAFDSIPAIFAITTDPFIVFTSNIFAILGLRSLYFVLANMQGMFEYLKSGLALILLFIAFKLIIKPFHLEIPIIVSLIFILCVLVVSILLSLWHHKRATLAVPAAMPAAGPVLEQHPAPLAPDHALVLKETTLPPAVVKPKKRALSRKATTKKKKR